MAKIITILERDENNEFKCKLEVEELEGYPLTAIIQALAIVADAFIQQLNQKKNEQNSQQESVQLPESQATS